jgi:hypothetical protein
MDYNVLSRKHIIVSSFGYITYITHATVKQLLKPLDNFHLSLGEFYLCEVYAAFKLLNIVY